MKLPNAHRSQIKICEKRQTRNVQFRFMPNAFRILKPIQKSSKCVWVIRNTGANAVAKNQTRLADEYKRDLYCICHLWLPCLGCHTLALGNHRPTAAVTLLYYYQVTYHYHFMYLFIPRDQYEDSSRHNRPIVFTYFNWNINHVR